MTSGAVKEDKNRSVVNDHQHHNQPPPPSQGYPNHPPPPQATGFPQPSQPSVEGDRNTSVVTDHQHHKQPPPPFQGPNYPPPPQQPPASGFTQQAQPYAPGYAVVGGMPVTQPDPLPCCGLGVGWVLFIVGFFITIPWYVGFILLLFSKNRRERPGYIACTVGAVFATISIVYIVVRESRAGL